MEHTYLLSEQDEMGVMTDCIEKMVKTLAEEVKSGQSSIEDVPGWSEVMKHPELREELSSLMRCDVQSSFLTKEETMRLLRKNLGEKCAKLNEPAMREMTFVTEVSLLKGILSHRHHQ